MQKKIFIFATLFLIVTNNVFSLIEYGYYRFLQTYKFERES